MGDAEDAGSSNLRLTSAYEEARAAPVYRLSELISGSFVATYVLGFTSFIAAYVTTSREYSAILEGLSNPPTPGTYPLVTGTLTYSTTAFYLSYDAGILTLPSLPFRDQAKDFTIAILQAFVYVLAMHMILLEVVLLQRNRLEIKALDDLLTRCDSKLAEIWGLRQVEHSIRAPRIASDSWAR